MSKGPISGYFKFFYVLSSLEGSNLRLSCIYYQGASNSYVYSRAAGWR